MALRIHNNTEYLSLPAGTTRAKEALGGFASWTAGGWVYAPAAITGPAPIISNYGAGQDLPVFVGVSYSSGDMTNAGRWVAAFYDDGSSDWDVALDTAAHDTGRWMHIVGMYEAGVALRLYKNGRLISTGGVAGYGLNPTEFRIGRRWNESAFVGFFDGWLQDVFIYSTWLQPIEVVELYKGYSPLVIRSSQLKGFWPLRDASGGLSLDMSPNMAHMTVVGTPTFESGPDQSVMGMSALIIGAEIPPPGAETHATDSRTIPIRLTVTGDEDLHWADSNEIYINLQASGTEFPVYTDAATVRVRFTIDSHDCQTRWDSTQLFARTFERFEHTSNHRWRNTNMPDRFVVVAGDGLEEC